MGNNVFSHRGLTHQVKHSAFAPEPNWSFKGTIMLRIIAP